MSSAWNAIASSYAAELTTSSEDVHFGVGIPGNRDLAIIAPLSGGIVIDLGCGSGENLVALARMGFRPFGVDSSEQQLATARKLLLQQSVEASLTLGDLSALGEGGIPPADLVLSVGAAHFFGSIETFVGLCSSLLKPGGDLVISVPHPVDMVTQVAERDGAREVVLESYFPMDGQVRNAHYWRRFAGRVSLAEGLIEYLWRPGHLVNTLVSSGFELRGMWEPEYTSRGTVPCAFRDPDPWFVAEFYKRVPQYLITKATKKRIEES